MSQIGSNVEAIQEAIDCLGNASTKSESNCFGLAMHSLLNLLEEHYHAAGDLAFGHGKVEPQETVRFVLVSYVPRVTTLV